MRVRAVLAFYCDDDEDRNNLFHDPISSREINYPHFLSLPGGGEGGGGLEPGVGGGRGHPAGLGGRCLRGPWPPRRRRALPRGPSGAFPWRSDPQGPTVSWGGAVTPCPLRPLPPGGCWRPHPSTTLVPQAPPPPGLPAAVRGAGCRSHGDGPRGSGPASGGMDGRPLPSSG